MQRLGIAGISRQHPTATCGLVLLAAALALWGCTRQEVRPAYAITGALLLDGTAQPPVEDSVVVVTEGKIVAMGPASQVRVPGGARRVDAHGRFVFPLIPDQPLRVEGPADLIVCDVNPARDPDYSRKVSGRMEGGRWTQYPN